MRKSNLLRRGLALIVIVPISVFGLAACAAGSGGDSDEDRTRAPRAEPEPDSGGGAEAPFQFSDEESETPQAEAPQSDPPTQDSGSQGVSGDVTVTFGEVDYSAVEWIVSCDSDPEEGFILGSANSSATSDAAHTFSASLTGGEVDFVMISDGTYEDGTALYWSDYSDGGHAELTIDGDQFTLTGEGYDYNDYSYQTLIPFEVSGTCGTVY